MNFNTWLVIYCQTLFLGDRSVVSCCILLNKCQINGDSIQLYENISLSSLLSFPFYSVGNK